MKRKIRPWSSSVKMSKRVLIDKSTLAYKERPSEQMIRESNL